MYHDVHASNASQCCVLYCAVCDGSEPCLTKSSRLQRETATDGGLEHYPEAGSAANIGIMLVRPSCNDFAKVCLRRRLQQLSSAQTGRLRPHCDNSFHGSAASAPLR